MDREERWHRLNVPQPSQGRRGVVAVVYAPRLPPRYSPPCASLCGPDAPPGCTAATQTDAGPQGLRPRGPCQTEWRRGPDTPSWTACIIIGRHPARIYTGLKSQDRDRVSRHSPSCDGPTSASPWGQTHAHADMPPEEASRACGFMCV